MPSIARINDEINKLLNGAQADDDEPMSDTELFYLKGFILMSITLLLVLIFSCCMLKKRVKRKMELTKQEKLADEKATQAKKDQTEAIISAVAKSNERQLSSHYEELSLQYSKMERKIDNFTYELCGAVADLRRCRDELEAQKDKKKCGFSGSKSPRTPRDDQKVLTVSPQKTHAPKRPAPLTPSGFSSIDPTIDV